MENLPFSTLHTVHLSIGMNSLDWALVVMISLCFCYAWGLPLLNFGLGRNTPYSRIEMIAGMPFGTLSIANFIYGMFKVVLSLIPLNAVILLFNNEFPWNSFDNCESSKTSTRIRHLQFVCSQTFSFMSYSLWEYMYYLWILSLQTG